MSLVTDPALLDDLNGSVEKKKNAANQVTDKKLIDELNNKVAYTEKSVAENFMAPLRAISPEDWKKESLAYPVLQTMRGLMPFQGKQGEQDYVQGMAGIQKKGDAIVEGVKQIATSPVQTAKQVASAVTERPAETAANMIKGTLYDPELLFTPGLKETGQMAGQAARATGRAVSAGAKTAGEVAEGAVNTLGGRGTRPGERATYSGQYESARQPAGTSYNLPENLQSWRDVNIDTAELNRRTVPYTAEQAAALKRTGGMVPYSGQVARATGEALAEPYTKFSGYIPDLALAGLGLGLGAVTGLGPAAAIAAPAVNIIRKGVSLYNAGKTTGAMRQLGDLGFKPLYPEEINAINKGLPHPSAIGPASGPVGAKTMAAAQINPASATTPAAQAAVQTTINKTPQVQPQPKPMAQPMPQAALPVEPPAPTKIQKMAEPHANTPLIDQALQQKIAQDPTLTGFDKSYVIPQAIKQPVENFLNDTTRHAVVHGAPGTGKTSLAGEWQARNPEGTLVYLDPKSFNKAQADKLKDASLTQNKVLYVVDEADKFTPTQVTHLTNLMDATKGNSKVLATTNDLSKVSKDLKTNQFGQIKVDTQLTPQERSAFALNVARQFNVNKTPAEIEGIANNPALKSFRDIKREVSKGYTLKEEPMMSAGSLKGRVDLPENLTTLLDDFNNNQTPKNLIIVDKTAFSANPKLSDSIDRAGTSLPMDKAETILPKTLARSNTASPTYIIDIRNAEDASKISALKGLIERSNETAYPTKLIIKDRYGHLDPALHSRAEMIDKSYFKNKEVDVAKAILRGEELGIVKKPKAQPEVKYDSPATMRRALFGTMPSDQMEALIKKQFPPK